MGGYKDFYGFCSDHAFSGLGALISPVCASMYGNMYLRSSQWHINGDADEFLKKHGSSMTFRSRISFVSIANPSSEMVSLIF